MLATAPKTYLNESLDFQHLKRRTWGRTGEDVNKKTCNTAESHSDCSSFVWKLSLSFSSHLSGCSAFMLESVSSPYSPYRNKHIHRVTKRHYCSVHVLILKIHDVQRFKASDIWCRACVEREPNKRFCIVACIFQSHFCC